MNTDLINYYRRRAQEYESIYYKPEREDDLHTLAGALQRALLGREVWEIACGTGYWTQKIAETARSITAGDTSEEVLEIARHKSYACPVVFRQEDFYRPSEKPAGCNALFGGFIWSHIPRAGLKEALGRLSEVLLPGSRIVFIDNRYVEGSSTPVYSKDEQGNTFQQRKLADGSQHLVLKNFPSADEIAAVLSEFGTVQIRELTYFWMAECDLFSNKKVVYRPV